MFSSNSIEWINNIDRMSPEGIVWMSNLKPYFPRSYGTHRNSISSISTGCYSWSFITVDRYFCSFYGLVFFISYSPWKWDSCSRFFANIWIFTEFFCSLLIFIPLPLKCTQIWKRTKCLGIFFTWCIIINNFFNNFIKLI